MQQACMIGRLAVVALCATFIVKSAIASEQVITPAPYCSEQEINSASPAPAIADSSSLGALPYVLEVTPLSGAMVVGLNDKGETIIRCGVADELSMAAPSWAAFVIQAVAGLKFTAPKAVNTSVPGGRYLVRVSTMLGFAVVHEPPRQTLLPFCDPSQTGETPDTGPPDEHDPSAPHVVQRVSPIYPVQAEYEGIEGAVAIVMDVYSNGAATPQCIAGSTPPGWFEAAAVEAVSQWTFSPAAVPGMGHYSVNIKFRLGDDEEKYGLP